MKPALEFLILMVYSADGLQDEGMTWFSQTLNPYCMPMCGSQSQPLPTLLLDSLRNYSLDLAQSNLESGLPKQ